MAATAAVHPATPAVAALTLTPPPTMKTPVAAAAPTRAAVAGAATPGTRPAPTAATVAPPSCRRLPAA